MTRASSGGEAAAAEAAGAKELPGWRLSLPFLLLVVLQLASASDSAIANGERRGLAVVREPSRARRVATAPHRSHPMQRCRLLRSSEGRNGKSELRAAPSSPRRWCCCSR